MQNIALNMESQGGSLARWLCYPIQYIVGETFSLTRTFVINHNNILVNLAICNISISAMFFRLLFTAPACNAHVRLLWAETIHSVSPTRIVSEPSKYCISIIPRWPLAVRSNENRSLHVKKTGAENDRDLTDLYQQYCYWERCSWIKVCGAAQHLCPTAQRSGKFIGSFTKRNHYLPISGQ